MSHQETSNRFRDLVLERQDPLRRHYRDAADDARIRDRARSTWSPDLGPFHSEVIAGGASEPWSLGIHRAVGGFHDLPNPGDLLCAALAGCLDTTLRILAARLGIVVERLEVAVGAELDVRGTLAVDRAVPVGMQQMRCELRLELSPETPPEARERLIAAAERSCVVLQTLRSGVPVSLDMAPASPQPGLESVRRAS